MRSFTALGAAVAVLGFATAASAADLPRREAMPAKAPMYAPLYNWTGLYVGVNLGGGWSDANSNFGKASGVVGGGQIGYNWQAAGSPFVLGLEADIQGTSIKNSADLGGGITGDAKVPAFGTVRARLGYAWDRFMVYGTGGFAYSDTKVSLTGPGGSISSDKWGSGWTVGGGVEWAFAGPWSVKAEYLYVNAKSVDLNFGGVNVSTGDYHYNVARLGLNYRF
ncbi:porin family protein [Pseudolabrys taiwanensis]|uniref:Porin family protein n=1 Tax=Pseudolabrys taiwanensis TaxID=331696 RepID=A0A345ZT35_9HYPH|nr:outer membrane protein [Pseudolabrys taiwanensis]AXK80082.1 porin family protein [Pseudolabrys taiwanensis]